MSWTRLRAGACHGQLDLQRYIRRDRAALEQRKELTVASRAAQPRRLNLRCTVSGCYRERGCCQQHLAVYRRVAHHAPPFHLAALCLKLRLHQSQHSATDRIKPTRHNRQQLLQRYKRSIDNNQINNFRQCIQETRVRLLYYHNPRIIAQLPMQQTLPDVYCVYPQRTALQQAVRETPG